MIAAPTRPVVVLAAVAGLALSGCAAVGSDPLVSASSAGAGPAYALPTARLVLEAWIDPQKDSIELVVPGLRFLPDPTHRYHLSAAFSVAHEETFDVTVNELGLLESVFLSSDGRVDEAIVAAAKSAGAILAESTGTGGGAGPRIRAAVFELDPERLANADPEDRNGPLARLNADLDNAIRGAIGARLEFGEDDFARDGFLAQALVSEIAIAALSLRRAFTPAPARGATPTQADCDSGICYRLPVSYVLSASFVGGSFQEARFAAPNGSPTFHAAIERGLFTKWETRLPLYNGMLYRYDIGTSGSEAKAAALTPFRAVGGLAEGVTARANFATARADMLRQRLAYEQAQANLAAARRGAPSQNAGAVQSQSNGDGAEVAGPGEAPAPAAVLAVGSLPPPDVGRTNEEARAAFGLAAKPGPEPLFTLRAGRVGSPSGD